MFRRGSASGGLEFFLAHPGGPFWANREDGAWTIPKGGVEAGEEILDAALREFQEETGIPARGPYISLGASDSAPVRLCTRGHGKAMPIPARSSATP